MTNTAGDRDIVFGLFWLLGFQFSPRLADIGEFEILASGPHGQLRRPERLGSSSPEFEADHPELGWLGGFVQFIQLRKILSLPFTVRLSVFIALTPSRKIA